jgi:hypothetical protein
VGFDMGSSPNTNWGAAPQDAPPSFGTEHVAAIGFASTAVIPPGGTATTTALGAQSTWTSQQTISWSAQPSGGVTVTPSSGSFSLDVGGRVTPPLTMTAGQALGSYPVTVHLTSSTGVEVPDVILTVAVANPGDLGPYFENTGISDTGSDHPFDPNQSGANAAADFDGGGYSYSAQALAASLITPGATVASGGINYTWPNVPAGQADNIVAAGQTIALPQLSGQAQLGVLGSSTNASGGVSGQAVVTYTDGSRQAFSLGLSDWTLNAGAQQPAFGNTTVATMQYRNRLVVQGCITNPICGAIISPDATATYVFSAVVAIDPSRTVDSITLPQTTGGAQMHVFAVAVSDVGPPASVPEAPLTPILPLVGASVLWAARRRRSGAPAP